VTDNCTTKSPFGTCFREKNIESFFVRQSPEARCQCQFGPGEGSGVPEEGWEGPASGGDGGDGPRHRPDQRQSPARGVLPPAAEPRGRWGCHQEGETAFVRFFSLTQTEGGVAFIGLSQNRSGAQKSRFQIFVPLGSPVGPQRGKKGIEIPPPLHPRSPPPPLHAPWPRPLLLPGTKTPFDGGRSFEIDDPCPADSVAGRTLSQRWNSNS